MKNFLFLMLMMAKACFAWAIFSNEYKEEGPIYSNHLPGQLAPNKSTTFIFDPKDHVWAVYDKSGKRVGEGHASGGKDYCPDIEKPCKTVEGSFKIFRKDGQYCISNTFPIAKGGGAPMPHCMFFHEGYAIHGAKNVPSDHVSHGCIRVSKKAAAWMNKHYIEEGSTVIVMPYG